MAFIGFGDMDDMFGRMDRMMNSMVNNMFGSDPFGSAFNLMPQMPPLSASMAPMSRLMASTSLMPSTMSMSTSITPSMTPHSSYYCSSSVMSMSTDMSGRPQIYESSHSTLAGPGGLKETRSSMRDSRTGMQKMSIGHHIDERGHVMERSRNHYTGEEEDNNEYINIEEEEAPQFNDEFRQRMNCYDGHRRRHLAVSGHRHHNHSPPQLALPAPPQRHEARQSPHKSAKNQKMSHKKHSDKKTKKPYKK